MISGDRDIASQDLSRLREYQNFIEQRRKGMEPAEVFSPEQGNAKEIASLIAAGGIVAMPWGAEIRRIMIIVAPFDDPLATGALNEIKGRPARQVLGIGCLPESAHFVAETEVSKPLINAAKRLLGIDQPSKIHLNRVLELLYEKNSVGVLLRAKDGLPDEVTAPTLSGRAVLVLGASDYQDPHDIYGNTLWELTTRYGKVLAGTSANPHGQSVYSVASQHQLYEELGLRVDGFVMFNRVPSRSPKVNAAASSTTIDLTGEQAKVMRWGSQHPLSFKKIFPDLIIPKDVAKEAHAEGRIGFLRRTLINRLY